MQTNIVYLLAKLMICPSGGQIDVKYQFIDTIIGISLVKYLHDGIDT